jgi:hypothetical protein
VQYLLPSYNDDVIFELPPSRVSASTSKNTMDSMDKRFNGHNGAAPSPPIFTTTKASLLGSPCVLASWFVTTRVVTSLLDPPSGTRLSG